MLDTLEYKDYGYDPWSTAFYFFGCAGFVTDGDWLHSDHTTPWEISRRHFWEVDREFRYPQIRRLFDNLDDDTQNVATMVILGSHCAVALCLEDHGYIKLEHLEAAKQRRDDKLVDYIDIPDVDIAGRLMKVRVINDGDICRIAIANSQGIILAGS